MPLTFSDGDSLYGLDQITMGGGVAPVIFYASDAAGNRAVEVKNVLDEVGSPRKAVGVWSKKTGTFTLQLDSVGQLDSASVATSMSIAHGIAPTGSAFKAWITSRDVSRSNENFATMTVGWEEILNP